MNGNVNYAINIPFPDFNFCFSAIRPIGDPKEKNPLAIKSNVVVLTQEVSIVKMSESIEEDRSSDRLDHTDMLSSVSI